MLRATATTFVCLATVASVVHGVSLDTSSTDSIKAAASNLASGVVSHYHGNETGHAVGILDAPYYWWESGYMFDTLIRYWKFTGDAQYNNLVSQGMQAQTGENKDFGPANQTKDMGNDDQATWALAAMSAVESKFPESQGNTTWLSLADAVFNNLVSRWDTANCGGGLRWQIFPFNTGYNFKNSISNGGFFELSSRLARQTGNATYSEWASKSFSWANSTGLLNNGSVYDGTNVQTNCKEIPKTQFSHAAGTFVSGVAYMYNTTKGDQQWKAALDVLLNTTLATFFPDGIAEEITCESTGRCNVDMKAYKGILIRALVDTMQMAPYTVSIILPKLLTSAAAAAKVCDGSACKLEWSGKNSKAGNSTDNIGPKLSALNNFQGLLFSQAAVSTGTAQGGTGTTTGGSSTVSGSASPTAKPNSGNSIGGENMKISLLVGLFGSMFWVML